ncbi:bifunctional diaminohydroxyphosphoribosylaminopyrimidine deaminase/5-amino-6-(5-phosphoribosylamino)uracil reductase RibD [Aureimonas altamirensis]|uniref:bifunctional diaminohydroxyphosphoribosylaminopyrimidine deaminase/5-amino-6-(5-phosphoribosylamino)uracil reductase RibD n=1 Tax=Aureimonas altamirensis TaxID=370622 RepID=UPI001E2A1B29|nr:bifunctional diaminohydroxyphosphoribosylaminopyrimidine deaminase/5-amino-6-(5-phosphoribosylamino)uracil reductase RibD [Aureimonas altamirensis]UHD43768.1 bifunctional diaminohydroxyphosphoribosylaminopyrimidine deaminase/5-amino-6-(5-phosphoribosylamino)uracil reductase RibD [Aureimonas altamirensis]
MAIAPNEQDDERFMAAAIRLSQRHVGATGSNPSVGALIVRFDGAGEPLVVGRGVTAGGGRPHAEVVALSEAGDAALGATVYVTLEPCSHHGLTPPCASALLRAGVRRVVIALGDPDGRVDGRGFAMLRAGGVDVVEPVGAAHARDPLAGFMTRMLTGRPLLTVKVAVSADGGIALAGHRPAQITSSIANAQTHLVRARSDAILVGVGTVASDDPMLTCRLPGLEGRSPIRVVYDPALRTRIDAKLVSTAGQVPTILAIREGVPNERRDAFREAGCEFITLAEGEGPEGLLRHLGERRVSSVLCEAGERLGRSVLDAGLADRIVVVRAPMALGPGRVVSPVRDDHLSAMRLTREERFGCDVWREYERI